MHINKVNNIVPNYNTGRNWNTKNNNKNVSYQYQQQNKSNPSFKGLMGGVDKFSLFIANLIENGGLAVSFTLQDMLGTNLPRPIMGLKRNTKENNGEANTNFAAKEMVREFLTGPSMFIIPAIMLTVGKKVFGKATEIPMRIIKGLGDIHKAQPLTKEGKAITKQIFYENAFTEILKNAKEEQQIASKSTKETAKKFASYLAKYATDKKSTECTINNLSKKFIDISKKHASDSAHTDFTQAFISKNTSVPFKDTVSYMMSYADDVVEKAASKNAKEIPNFLSKHIDKKVFTRLGTNILMYASVLGFLQLIPRLYNRAEGKDNAGLKGLMKKETFYNSTDFQNKEKSKPSFGSASSVVNKLTGTGLAGRIAKGIEFEGINLSFPLLLGVMSGGIILPRTLQAKDKYDRSEIVRRDLVTCAVMCFAEKELRKGFSKLNETKSGMVLAMKDSSFKDKSSFKKLFDYLRPIKGVQVLSTDQIVSKYTNIHKYKEGITGFCNFIDKQGGNLSKVFSVTDKSKNIVDNLLKNEGLSIANAENSVIINVLDKAKDSKEVKELTDLFKAKNNPWVQKARTINSRFTAFSVLVLVPVFLGFMLPWINEKATKKRINQENQQGQNSKPIENTQTNIKNYDKIKQAPNIFSDIQNMK